MSTATDLQQGKLEQTCPDCGRWEAAHRYCSWCLCVTGEADWYRNGDTVERAKRLPLTAPVSPPPEYRASTRDNGGGWPAQWGESPYQRQSRPSPTPDKQL